jgi:D-alanine-D-alanine ligase
MTRTKVLLLFGGESSEHEVSLASAHNVFAALDDDSFDVFLCYIDKKGKWWLTESVDDETQGKSQLAPVLGTGQFATIPYKTMFKPDVILPILHGKNGEDGTVQGLASLMHVPIAGPSLLGAAITMDKEVAKRLLRSVDIPVVDWELYRAYNDKPQFSDISSKLGNPVFVKPANAGSSVGVNKAHDDESFNTAIDEAAKHDNKILVERAVVGRELEVAVLGNEDPEATPAGEIKSNDDFYSYDAKYGSSSKAEVIIPAEGIDDALQNKIRDIAVNAYLATECRGLARVDFFYTENGDLFVNEINSIPGFTNISMYPKLWRHNGVGYPQLIERIIKLAIAPAKQIAEENKE